MSRGTRFWAIVALVLGAGCNGQGSSSFYAMPPGAQPPGIGGPAGNAVRFVFKIPKAIVRSAPGPAATQLPGSFPGAPTGASFPALTTPAPYSTTTPSATPLPNGALAAAVKLTVTPVGGRAMGQPLVLNLSAPNGPCITAYGQLQCTLAQSYAAGTYVVTVGVYSSPNASGGLLGAQQSIAFSAFSQRSTTVSMAVGAAPASLTAAPAGFAVRGTQAGGFTIYGTATQQFVVNALDVTGDVIVGPGAPPIGALATTGSTGSGAWQIGQLSTTAPNVVGITPPSASISSATVQVTAQYTDATCSQPGAVCTASFSMVNDLQMLFVANCTASCNGKSSTGIPGSVTMYAPPYTGAPVATILNGVVQPIALLTDPSENLYVANAFGGTNNAGSVTVYAPPYTGTPVTISSGISNPGAIALDNQGNLWVANQGGNGSPPNVAEYGPPFGGRPVRVVTSFTGVPTSLAFDLQGNLFVANGNALVEFSPPYNGPPATVASGIAVANGFTFDSAGDLYYVDSNGGVSVYTPPYTAAAMQLPRINGTLGLLATYPAGGLLFVPDGSGNIQEFVAPFTGPPQAITANNPSARGIGVDGAGNVFVVYCGSGCGNNGTDSVTIYAPPYSGSPSVITSGISAPSALTLTR